MRLLFQFLPVIFLLSAFSTARSQDDVPEYTVQIGNFINPKPADFANLSSLGFVYAIERPSSYTDVFMGGYAGEREAERVAQNLKTKGYDNAFVSKLNVDGGQSVVIIQLANKKVGDKINWDDLMKLERLYVLLNGNQIKIVTGIYPDAETARAQLPKMKQRGFPDAFVKNVNNAMLHEIGEFESGGAPKKPLIPLDFATKAAEEEKKADEQKAAAKKPAAEKKADVPSSYDEVAVIGSNDPKKTAPKSTEKLTAKSVEVKENAALTENEDAPDIRATVKRTSALDMQKVLKAEGIYKGSLDGFYGKGTKIAFDQALNSNRQLQKYRILAKHLVKPDGDAPRGSVQFFINNLWQDSKGSLDGLEKSKAPIAKAYRAYFMFVNEGISRDVNTLMNEAIKEAFVGNKAVNLPKFDYKATYAYDDLDQLLLHIRYIHEVSPDKPAAPCWLFRKHPGAALRAFEPKGGSTDSDFLIQNCGGFWEWEEVQILHAMSQDIAAQSQISEAKVAASQSQLARLYLTPKALNDEERKTAETWHTSLWKGIEGWATRDPMLEEMSTSLRIAYLQSQVLLEDYFMDEGFSEKEAKALALAALKALVGHQLERFV